MGDNDKEGFLMEEFMIFLGVGSMTKATRRPQIETGLGVTDLGIPIFPTFKIPLNEFGGIVKHHQEFIKPMLNTQLYHVLHHGPIGHGSHRF